MNIFKYILCNLFVFSGCGVLMGAEDFQSVQLEKTLSFLSEAPQAQVKGILNSLPAADQRTVDDMAMAYRSIYSICFPLDIEYRQYTLPQPIVYHLLKGVTDHQILAELLRYFYINDVSFLCTKSDHIEDVINEEETELVKTMKIGGEDDQYFKVMTKKKHRHDGLFRFASCLTPESVSCAWVVLKKGMCENSIAEIIYDCFYQRSHFPLQTQPIMMDVPVYIPLIEGVLFLEADDASDRRYFEYFKYFRL